MPDEADEDAVMDDLDTALSNDDVGETDGSLLGERRRTMAPPIVVVKQRSQRGGARPGAGRKRKKVQVASSDEE